MQSVGLVGSWRRMAGVVLAAVLLSVMVSTAARAAEILDCSFMNADDLLLQTRERGWRIMDRRGQLIGALGAYYGPPVAVGDLPPYLVKAVLTAEDQRFFDHGGLDYWRIGGALYANLKALRPAQGASTITQQTLKNTCYKHDDKVWRKLKELWTAGNFEAVLSKPEILYIYLNSIFFGGRAYGIEAATRVYFGKYARALTLLESAVLAQMIKAPNTLNPHVNLDLALKRAGFILDAMVKRNVITAAEVKRAKRQKLRLAVPETGLPGFFPAGLGRGWFVEWARAQAAASFPEQEGVIKVTTTLDSRLQDIAERHLREAFQQHSAHARFDQGAVIVMSPTGEVLAMVGGRDYRTSQWNNAVKAQRQPGSAFKLFVYLMALEAGKQRGDVVQDDELILPSGIQIRNHDGRYRGPMTLEGAFALSRNTVAVQLVMQRVPRVIEVAKRLGISTSLTPEVGLALGASEVLLHELTGAYAAVANGGLRVAPGGIVAIHSNRGERLSCAAPQPGSRVIDQAHVAALRAMLRAVVHDGTGRNADPGFPAYGKTGTTNENKDAWFIGFTDRFVVGVWVGNEKPQPMNGVTGGTLPAQIFRSIVRDTTKLPSPAPARCETESVQSQRLVLGSNRARN